MSPQEVKELNQRLRRCLGKAERLPLGDIDSIEVLITAGEWALALDTLCTQIYEYDIEVPTLDRNELLELGRKLDVPVAYLLGDPWAEKPG